MMRKAKIIACMSIGSLLQYCSCIKQLPLRPSHCMYAGHLRKLFHGYTIICTQNKPVILPVLSTSMFSAAGTFGSPGIVIMSPA